MMPVPSVAVAPPREEADLGALNLRNLRNSLIYQLCTRAIEYAR